MPVIKNTLEKLSAEHSFICKNKERQIYELVKILCALGEIAHTCMEKL